MNSYSKMMVVNAIARRYGRIFSATLPDEMLEHALAFAGAIHNDDIISEFKIFEGRSDQASFIELEVMSDDFLRCLDIVFLATGNTHVVLWHRSDPNHMFYSVTAVNWDLEYSSPHILALKGVRYEGLGMLINNEIVRQKRDKLVDRLSTPVEAASTEFESVATTFGEILGAVIPAFNLPFTEQEFAEPEEKEKREKLITWFDENLTFSGSKIVEDGRVQINFGFVYEVYDCGNANRSRGP